MKKKSLAILIGLLVTIGLVGAGIRNLSDRVTAEMVVESPMVVGISLGEGNWGGEFYPQSSHNLDDWTITDTPLKIPVMMGGETVTLYTMSANEADADITGFENATVTNLDGVTCDDFESVIVRVDSIYGKDGYGTPLDLIEVGGCKQFPGYVLFGNGENSLWGKGETDVTEIVVTFEEAAFGTYVFTYQVIPEVEA